MSPRRAGAVEVRRLNLEGDRQADLSVHGGPDKAVYAYPAEHYAYWREKWGFDMLNPDMPAVLERWGGTEVCWRYDREMREAGERIAAAYEANRSAAQRGP